MTIAGVTPSGYNGTYVATVTGSTTYTVTTSGSNLGNTTVSGTTSVPAQASITARSAGTKGLIVKAAASQAVSIQDWQNSSGTTVAQITSSGGLAANYVQTGLAYVQIADANGGGVARFTKSTSAQTNPGASLALIYFRDGTNANTLKLCVRAGTAGAETTILDNIPT